MKFLKAVFFYIFMSSIFLSTPIEPMFTELSRRHLELARKKVMDSYKWAKEKLFGQPEPIASPKISVPDPSLFSQHATQAEQAMISVGQQEKADSAQSVAVNSPEENIVYVTGLEGTESKYIVEIPLEIARKMTTLNDMLGDILVEEQTIFEHTIPLPQFSTYIIQKVVNLLKDIGEKNLEEKTEKDKEKELEEVINLFTTKTPLNQQLLCLRFCDYMDLKEIMPIFIDKVLYNLSKASFKDMQNSTALDDLKSSDGSLKELFFHPLQEVLRLLIIQKYANERKKVLQHPQLMGSVSKILCNKDATVITFDSADLSVSGPIYYDFYIFDTNHSYSSLVSENRKILADISKDGKNILAISSVSPFKLCLYSQHDNIFEEKILDDSNNMHYLSARLNDSETKIVTLARSREGKAIIKWWDITDINNPLPHSIEFSEDITFSGPTNGHGKITFPYIDFIDDSTIVAFAIDNSVKLKIIFHTLDKVQSSQESLELFSMSFTTAICDINKKNYVAIYRWDGDKKNMYIIENKQIKEIVPFKKGANSIKFSTDGSKIICSGLEGINKKIVSDVEGFRWPRNNTGNESLYDIKNKIYVPALDNTVNTIHADCLDNTLVYAQNILFPIKSHDPNIQSDKYSNPIILTILPPSSSHGIAKYISFQTNLSGLSGEVIALRFSPDGNKIIAAGAGKDNNVIVWPLVTQEEDEALKNLNKKMDISLAKLLLPISIASLKRETTVIATEQQSKINKILLSLPKSIADTLLITIEQSKPVSIHRSYLQKSFDWQKQKLLSQDPTIRETE